MCFLEEKRQHWLYLTLLLDYYRGWLGARDRWMKKVLKTICWNILITLGRRPGKIEKGDENMVPEILYSGHHRKIKEWRHEQAEKTTRARRPDLWKKYITRN